MRTYLRNTRPALLGAALVAAVAGCSDRTPTSPTAPTSPPAPPIAPAVLPAGVDACGDPLDVDLLAGQDLDAGSVTIANDETTLYVTYVTEDGWTIQATHLDVAGSLDEIPTNSTGNPTVGQFTFQDTHDGATRVSYAVALADLGVDSGDDLIVVAQAEVGNFDLHKKETAWADGARFTDGSWATYATYTVQTCAIVLAPTELCSEHDADAIATFADSNLEAAVRNALGVGTAEDLTCGLLESLTSLVARFAGIGDLAGIQNLSSLTSLDLLVNSISDISPLGGLTSLRSLRLDNNDITDIGPLAGLGNLTSVTANSNSIADLGPLSNLTGLTRLSLGHNAITDVSPLSDLSDLTTLGLSSNQISDIGPLAELTGLEWLALEDNAAIDDFGPVSALTNLTVLRLRFNSISDLSPFSGLTHLEVLFLNDNSISDLSPLSGLGALRVLRLDDNAIMNVDPLGGLTNLNGLHLRNNPSLADIQPLLDNTGLGSGDGVDLRSTAVPCDQVDALEAKGVTVLSDCP